MADHTLVSQRPWGLPGWDGASSACHTLLCLPFQFLTQHRNLNHTKQRLLEVANYVNQVGVGGKTPLKGWQVLGEVWQAWR